MTIGNPERFAYGPSEIERWSAELPALRIRQVPDVNHYTIIMSPAGASAVASEVLRGRQR